MAVLKATYVILGTKYVPYANYFTHTFIPSLAKLIVPKSAVFNILILLLVTKSMTCACG